MNLENLFKDKKNWIIGLCIAQICLILIYSIGALATNNFYSPLSQFISILDMIVGIVVFALAILAVVKESKFWTKTLFITYFAYIFFTNMFGFYTYLYNFSSSDGINVCFGIFGLIDSLLVVAIGIVYMLTISGIIKNEKITDILVGIRLISVAILFIISIVAIATSGALWYSFLSYLQGIVVTLLFFVATKFNEPAKVENQTNSSSEENEQTQE